MAKKAKSLRWPLADRLDERLGARLRGRRGRRLHRVPGERQGEFHFRYFHGHMDCRLTMKSDEPVAEWSWDGNDEMDPAQGRGWAVVKGNELHGMIFFHGGDDSEFVAKRMNKPASSRRNRRSSS